jgi:hypothetical protein
MYLFIINKKKSRVAMNDDLAYVYESNNTG